MLEFEANATPRAVPAKEQESTGEANQGDTVDIAPDAVFERLVEYADLFGANPLNLYLRYSRSGIHYSLDIAIALTNNPERTMFRLSGANSTLSGSSRTFGYSYFHAGVVLLSDATENPPHKRTTIFGIDPDAMRQVSPTSFRNILVLFEQCAKLANHDPLHSLNGSNIPFRDLDRHIRFGGVEFAPLLVHAALVQRRLNSNTEAAAGVMQMVQDYAEAIMPDSEHTGFEGVGARMYFASIFLRQLLLVLPYRHEAVQTYLDTVDKAVFGAQDIETNSTRWADMLNRDFSPGDHPDQLPADYPAHRNRLEPYNHGRDSMLLPWIRRFFAERMDLKHPGFIAIPVRDFLVLDVLSRGHGIYGSISAAIEDGFMNDLEPVYKRFSL